jgi:hypothetical protein
MNFEIDRIYQVYTVYTVCNTCFRIWMAGVSFLHDLFISFSLVLTPSPYTRCPCLSAQCPLRFALDLIVMCLPKWVTHTLARAQSLACTLFLSSVALFLGVSSRILRTCHTYTGSLLEYTVYASGDRRLRQRIYIPAYILVYALCQPYKSLLFEGHCRVVTCHPPEQLLIHLL